MKKMNASAFSERKMVFIQYAFFLLIIWIAYFIKFNEFGLYEDDYWYVGKPINLSFRGLFQLLGDNITNIEGGQGRIIGFTLPQLLAFLSFRIGGLGGVYVLGSLMIFLNAILVFNFVRKILPVSAASMAAILFILYPADTTKPLLIHIFQLQLSLMFVLLALNQYAKNRKWLAFVFAICSLLTYENAFLPFLAVPLFISVWDKKLLRRFFIHLTICFAILFCVFFIRKLMGETRAGEVEIVETVKMALMSLLIGPLIALSSFVLAIFEALTSIHFLKWIFLLSLVVFTCWILLVNKFSFSSEKVKNRYSFLSFITINVESEKSFNRLIRLIIAAVFMLICSYLFAFTHYPPIIFHGRSTSVHLASSIAGSILIALIIYLLFYLFFKNKPGRIILFSLTVLLFSFLLSRSYLIQNDFKESWKEQKVFWREIINVTPDVKENTIILVNVEDQKENLKNIQTYSWPIPEIFNQIVAFDTSWHPVPKVVVIGNTFADSLVCNEKGIYFEPVYSFLFEDRERVFLENGNIIYLNYSMSKVTRVDTLIVCDTLTVKTMAVGNPGAQDWKLNPVGELFLED